MHFRVVILFWCLLAWVPFSKAAQSNLGLLISASPLATENELITWRLTISNSGPNAASGVVVTNWPPPTATLFSVTSSQGSIATNAGALRVALGTLAVSGAATVDVIAFSGTFGNLSNRAVVVSDSTDPQPANNSASNNVRVVSPRFQFTGSMLQPRQWHTATLLSNGRVLITGGRNAGGNMQACELFDPATGQFSATSDTLGSRVLHEAVALTNGRVLIVGGVPDVPEVYDPNTGTWAFTGPMVFPRAGSHSAAKLNDGRVLVTGGYGTWTAAELFNPAANTWTVAGPMSARQQHSSVTLTNGRVLLLGGYYAGTNVEAFVPATGTFTPAGSVLTARDSEATVRLNDNTVLMAGGYTGEAMQMRNAEIYNPTTQTSSALGELVTPRWDFPGVLLTDGRVLLTGGATAYVGQDGFYFWAVTADTEVYTPATQSFAPTIALNTPRRNHTATRLLDGRVLVTGGYHSTPTGDVALASAEIFDPASAKPPPSISISDAAVAEGNAGANELTFNVTLSGRMGVPVTVDFGVTSMSAEFGADYFTSAGQIVFAPGVTSQSLVVAVAGDTTFEPDESFHVALFNPSNAVLARSHSAVGTLLNDDPLPTLHVSSPSVVESNLLTSAIEFLVTLSNPNQEQVQVAFMTTNGTAQPGTDYLRTNGVLMFPPGVTTQSVTVIVNGDITVEPDEWFQLGLLGAVNAAPGPAGTGTILNDDGLPGRVHFFEVSPVSSPQHYEVPFPLTLTARSVAGAPAPSFNGPVMLRTLSNAAPAILVDMEHETATNWAPVFNLDFPLHFSSFGFAPFDVTGHGVPSRALLMDPFFDWTFGVRRPLPLVGGVTYEVRVDVAQQNGVNDRYFDYVLDIEGVVVAEVPIQSIGLPHGQTDRRSIGGTFTAPSNGTYSLTFMLTGAGSTVDTLVYLDNLRVEPAGATPALVTLTNGVWSGVVSVAGAGNGLVLQALDYEGHTGFSNPFDVLPTADVGTTIVLEQAESPDTYQEITVRCWVTNRGPAEATSVVFTNTLPAGWRLLSAETTSGQIVVAGGTVSGAIPTLAVNGSVCVTLAARTGGEGTFDIQSTALAPGVDHDLSNNIRATPVSVLPPRVTISGGVANEAPAASAVFTLILSSSNDTPASVVFATSEGSARAGFDFVGADGTAVFPPGVRTQLVAVTVLDDLLDEPDETFSLALSAPVHLRVDAPGTAEATLISDDPPPAVSIGDAAVVEGDISGALLSFPITLSALSGRSVTFDYRVINGTAVAGGDFDGTPGSVTIPPGQTSGVVVVTVFGDTINEADEIFAVTLTDVVGASLLRGTASGTIQNDDAVPGKFDHFAFDAIPPLRLTNAPFHITIRAVDYLGAPVTNSPVSAQLRATSGPPSGISVTPSTLNGFSNGAWSGLVAIPAIRSNVTLRVQDGAGRVGVSGTFNTVARFTATLGLVTSVSENAGTLPGAGTLTLAGASDEDVLFTLASSDTNLLRVPLTVLLPAWQTNVNFDLAVFDDPLLNGTRSATVTASALGYNAASAAVTIHDDEAVTLTLTLPASLSETKALDQGIGTVQLSRPVDVTSVLFFSTDNSDRLFLQASVTVAAGQSSASFLLIARDNSVIDGSQTVGVIARFSPVASVTNTLAIHDNDTNIAVSVNFGNSLPIEGTGVRTNALSVQLSGVTTVPVVVQLASSRPDKVAVPLTVTVPAGRAFIATNVVLFDDLIPEVDVSATITATAPGFAPGTRTFTVYENDVHHIALAPIPVSQTSGVPFNASFSVRDANNSEMSFFRGSLALTASREGLPLPVLPGVVSNLLRGSWTGPVTINGWGTNTILSITAPGAVTQASNPINLLPPVWAADVRIQDVRLEPAGVRVRFHTVTNRLYQLQVATNFPAMLWTQVGPPQSGTGADVTVFDSRSSNATARFYRLTVTE